MFVLKYPSLGSSYSPNLTLSKRIETFKVKHPDPVKSVITQVLLEEEQALKNQLNAICEQNYTYIFTVIATINNSPNPTPSVPSLVLSIPLQFCGSIKSQSENGVSLTLTTNTNLPAGTIPLEPTYNFNTGTQILDITIDPVYTNMNVLLNIVLLMEDGSTHKYNSPYYGENLVGIA